jgi:hypothetical protein
MAAPASLMPPLPDLEKFRDNLIKGMTAKNMSGSDVARAVWGSKTNAQGRQVARNRDRMTWYLAGRGYPRPETVAKLAQVLDLDPADLEREYDKAVPSGAEPIPSPVNRLYDAAAVAAAGPHPTPFTLTLLPDRDVLVTFHMKMDGPSAMRFLDAVRALIPELNHVVPADGDDPAP